MNILISSTLIIIGVWLGLITLVLYNMMKRMDNLEQYKDIPPLEPQDGKDGVSPEVLGLFDKFIQETETRRGQVPPIHLIEPQSERERLADEWRWEIEANEKAGVKGGN